MVLSVRRTVALVAVLGAAAGAAPVTNPGPRNPAAEAATGDMQAMRAAVQDVVECLRAKGFDPGDPQVQGENVVISDWDPAWDSPAGSADRECAFPVR